MRSKARVRVKPKHYFCDPPIATALLEATPDRLLHDTQALGMLFENLVIRDLRVFLSTYAGLGNSLSYCRDDSGLEVDAIVEHGGRWAGIEIKLSDTKADEGATSLLVLKKKVPSNPQRETAGPRFWPSLSAAEASRTRATTESWSSPPLSLAPSMARSKRSA